MSQNCKLIIKDEVNVKEVTFEKSTGWEVEIDTELTPELEQEGYLREFIRNIQQMRKTSGLTPSDTPTLVVQVTSNKAQNFVNAFLEDIAKAAFLKTIVFESLDEGEEVKLGEMEMKVFLKK